MGDAALSTVPAPACHWRQVPAAVHVVPLGQQALAGLAPQLVVAAVHRVVPGGHSVTPSQANMSKMKAPPTQVHGFPKLVDTKGQQLRPALQVWP